MSFLLDWINWRRGGPHDPPASAPPETERWADLEMWIAAQITKDSIAGHLSDMHTAGAHERARWLFDYIRERRRP